MGVKKICSFMWDDAEGHHECLNFAVPGTYRCEEHKKPPRTPRVGELSAGMKEAIRKRDGYKCVECGTAGNEVDHIVPLRDFPEEDRERLGNRPDNLQTLCFVHHKLKTVRENRDHLAPVESFDYSTSSRNRHRRRMRQQGYYFL